MPEVTVVITTYRRAALLKDAIRSVLAQTFSDFELVVVDDASLDDTEKVVRSFGDRRISYIRHETNKGDAAAKNTGIRSAKGKYIITLDDDDLMAPNALEALVDKIRGTGQDTGGAYGWSWWTYEHGKTLKVLAPTREASFQRILSEQLFTNILLKGEVFEKVGLYDESLKSNYDHDFYLRLSKAYKLEVFPQILFVIRVQQKHLSAISLSHMESHEEVSRRYDPKARKKGVLLLRIVPSGFYVLLSVLKHKALTLFRLLTNSSLRGQIDELRRAFNNEGIVL